jgi:mono/diheme cytochrome c family protein
VRARIGLQTEPDATPAEALIQACGSCHNDVLDQSLSRARFSIALGRLSRAEIDLAIARIELPKNAPGVMPPPEARQLAPEARDDLLEYLRGDLEHHAIDPMLERAAQLGMRGGGNTNDPPGLIEIQP